VPIVIRLNRNGNVYSSFYPEIPNMEEMKTESPWRKYFAEFLGTAILLLLGLSLVIFMFGEGSPADRIIPVIKVRQAMTGFLFGCVGASIALSPLGKTSGAHVNPVVTLAFRLFGKIDIPTALGYIIAQLCGAIAGCLPLLIWGSMGKSVDFGATVPGQGYSTMTVLLGEVVTTFALVAGLILFLGFHRIRRFTPAMIPFLYAIMVPLEAAISGTSTNPARTLGPAIISGEWHGWWIYWVGPVIGASLACIACSALAKRITEAKLYHFDSEKDRLLRK
jgi:aquaporin Z